MLRRGFVDNGLSWVRRHRLLPHPHGDTGWKRTGQASSPACRAASTREQSASRSPIAPRRVYDPAVRLAHTWRPGDVVMTDNHALLHGRRAYTDPGRRHLQRVNIL
jgi:hypothetical protein